VNFGETVRAVAGQLDEASCRWVIIGGVALGLYTTPRTTCDVDLLVDGSFASRLPALLCPLGYTVAFAWEESTHLAPTRADRCPLDILHAHRPHSLGMLARAQRFELEPGGLVVPVAEPEDLIGLKVQAMENDPERRRGELVDIRALLESAASTGRRFDLARVREYFALFGEDRELGELMEGLEDALR
jgi:predicted nucleotidyltransferase